MSSPFIGQIMMVGFNFAPRGWAFCDGQLLPIAQNQALFALLGTTYGGNGTTTFALPDLRGRVPIHKDQGPGLSNYSLGQMGGAERVTLTTNEMPTHSHSINASTNEATDTQPTGKYLATGNAYTNTANTTMNSNAAALTGGNQSHENRQPFLVINFVIALQGIFPSRN